LESVHFPAAFTQTIIDLFGDRGFAWLDRLPKLIAECEQRWSLTVLPPFPLSYNYVAPAIRSDGAEVVLKLGVPNKELFTEIAALRLYEGRGSCMLLDAIPDQGLLLLERLKPGKMLASLADDEKATSIAVQVMRQLWRPAPPEHPFPTLAHWTSGLKKLRPQFGGTTGPFPAELVDRALKLFEELISSSTETVLLHGDLHHYNILTAERQPWLALDPKGVVGDPCYEVGALFYNPEGLLDRSNLRQVLARRADQLSEELGFDRQRVLGYGIAQAVLSAWWSYEDHGHGWEPTLVIADHLKNLLGK
jgi:streptomycin 6-kinase